MRPASPLSAAPHSLGNQAISFPAIATSATPTKNLFPTPVLVAEAPLLLHGPPLQNKLATSAFNRAFRAMGPIPAVSPVTPF